MSLLILTALSAGELKMPPPRPWVAPTVTLVDPGGKDAKARKPLRYRLVRGKGSAELTASGEYFITTRGQRGGGPMPNLALPFGVVVESATQWAFKLSTATATGAGLENDPLTPTIVKALDGVTGVVTTDDRGLASKLALQPSPNDTQHQADLKKIELASYYALEMLRTAFMHVLTPLPLEPIAVGGSWRVDRPQTRGGITYTETATYTLKGYTPKGALLSVKLGGQPDPMGPVRVGQLDLQVSGQGELELDLSVPVPTKLDEHLTLHALVGPPGPSRNEHEGAMANQLRFKGE